MLTLEFLGTSQLEVEIPQTIRIDRAKGEVTDTENAHPRAHSLIGGSPPSTSTRRI